MADSSLWEEAYRAYSKKTKAPMAKHVWADHISETTNIKPPKRFSKESRKAARKASSVSRGFEGLGSEPMVLIEEYINLVKQIKELTTRRTKLKKYLEKYSIDPTVYTRSAYFKKPIMLYVLRLEHDCWYIGMSRNVDKRFKSHSKGKAWWTNTHKPIEIFEKRETGLTSDSAASKLEDELTLEFARKYGTDRVRGGGYCQRKPIWPIDLRGLDDQLTDEQLGHKLKQMFRED